MSHSSKNNLPLPNCWHQSWLDHAARHKLDKFPTRQHLKSNPGDAGPFCLWLWRQLVKAEGRMCDQTSSEECENCQRNGVSKIISIQILSLIIKDEDPTLHFVLNRQFNMMKDAYPHRRTGHRPVTRLPPEPPPNNSPTPLPPIAVNMPRPMPPVMTSLVARELRNKPWLRDWLET